MQGWTLKPQSKESALKSKCHDGWKERKEKKKINQKIFVTIINCPNFNNKS